MIINKTNFGIVDLSSTVGPQSGKPSSTLHQNVSALTRYFANS
jgi:hypothetical protein